MSLHASFHSESSKVWYDRLNLMHKFKKFCQWCTGKFEFWCLVAFCTLIEPILCSKWPTGYILLAQVIVLAASTGLYVIQLIGVASREWERIIMIEAMSSLQSLAIPKHMMDLSLLKIFIFFAAEGEYILEFFCLTIGWILIFWHPGLAALRCFRPFRLLWFYEVEIFRSSMEFYFSPILGEVFVGRGFRVLKFAIKALSALGNEMFRLTADTKGGLLLMMIFFYSAFVLGTSLWIETGAKTENCTTAGSCMYTLMRLTFFDGNGFDFAYSLTNNHRILFVITIMYLCLTSFGILNGLVGIFGTAFARASDLAFEDEEDRAAVKEATTAAIKAASRRDLYSDDNEEDDGKPKPQPEEQQQQTRNKLKGFMGSRATMGNLIKGQPPQKPVPEEKQIPKTASTAKLTMKDLVGMSRNKKKAGSTYPYEPVLSNIEVASVDNKEGGDGVISPPLMSPSPPKGRPQGGGMFGRQLSSKASMGSMPAMPLGSTASLQEKAQMSALTSHVNILQRKLEKQSELMSNMFDHILFLQSQLTTAHPQLNEMNLHRPPVVDHVVSESPDNISLAATMTPFGGSGAVTPFRSTPTNALDKVKAKLKAGISEKSSVSDEDVHLFSEKDEEVEDLK